MLDSYADWEVVGQEHELEEEETKGVAVVEGCWAAYVGREEEADQGKGWVMRETCLMEKVEV